MPADDQPKSFRKVAACIFIAGLLFLFFNEMKLAAELSYLWPFGGNDEPMHLSMARSIAKHGQWPRWDSEDLMRYRGVSYASSSSFNYWIEGILQRLTGRPRWSPRLLFVIYLIIVTRFAVRNPVVGLIGLAAVVPQVLFVFSYVNSDAWTAIVALLLGLATVRFRRTPSATMSTLFLFVAAGLCLSCRPHMWIIGFMTFMFAVVPNIARLLKENRSALVYSFIVSLAVASWWPVTSYFANNGDFTSRYNAQNEINRFATLDTVPFGASFASIKLGDFVRYTACSFYGWWGWAMIPLPRAAYWTSLFVGLPLLIFFLLRPREYFPLFLTLIAVNYGLMLYGATKYDSMWQGRYLYPSYFVIVGILLQYFGETEHQPLPACRTRILIGWLTVFLMLNGWSISSLSIDSNAPEANWANYPDRFQQSVAMMNSGMPARAIRILHQGVMENPLDHRTRNLLGYLLTRQGRVREARQMLETAQNIEPDDHHIRIHLGELDMREGKTNDAIINFHQALVQNPLKATRKTYLWIVWCRTSRWDIVMQLCRDSLQKNPENKHARELLSYLEQWYAQFP